ncbi:hypothetical protein [Fluviicola sp.]|uniref:hypothetical protein n=1 Tax=Fluviicola sp. TaxID=1917219 RepID=UPI00262F8586|nr:hypothetical protein [Fluviicola sp.]
MNRKISTLITVMMMTLVTMTTVAQDQSDQAKNYFAEYLTSKSMTELIARSLPTLEECKLVFKEQDAETYFKAIEAMKSKAEADPKEENETFSDVQIDRFSTEDIEQQKGNYAGGMDQILEKLQLGVVFYKVSLLREKDAERGLAFKYWVHINGRWVFFPKPYHVFEK